MKQTDIITLNKLIVTFPNFYSFPTFTGEENGKPVTRTGKAGCKLLIDSDSDSPKQLKIAIRDLYQENNDIIDETTGKGRKLAPDKYCLRDGNDSERASDHGKWVLSASAQKDQLPMVFGLDGQTVISPNMIMIDGVLQNDPNAAQKQPFVSGNLVNVQVRLWWQNHPTYKKRVNCELIAVQYAGKGEPMSGLEVDKEAVSANFGAVELEEASGSWATSEAPADDDFL